MSKETNNGKQGGELKGNSHDNGGIKAVVTDSGNKPVELEGDEVIIKKAAVADPKTKTLTGTNKEILHQINVGAGGNPILSKEEIYSKWKGIYRHDPVDSREANWIDRLNKTPIEKWDKPMFKKAKAHLMKQGGEVASWDKVAIASSRFKPSETIVFDPPLIGLNGSKLISYTWSFEWVEEPNREGEMKPKRKSDWTQAENSAETGRDIVHKYGVMTPDGEVKIVSSDSVLTLLGYVDRKQPSSFPKLATAAKTLAKQQMQLAVLEAQKAEYDELYKKFSSSQKPEIKAADLDQLPQISKWMVEKGDNSSTFFAMGDVIYRQSNESRYDEKEGKTVYTSVTTPDRTTKEQLEYQWISKRIEEAGGVNPRGLYDLKNRVARQTRKVENILGTKMAEGGSVDEDFDWDSLFAEETPEEKAKRDESEKLAADQEKEEWFQKKGWSKKYATTYKEAVDKTIKNYLDAKATYEDWGSRTYKSNKGIVYAGGDDVFGEAYTISGVNENRKRNRMMGAKMQMEESIEMLKDLGLSPAEIEKITSGAKMAEGGPVNSTNEDDLAKIKAAIDNMTPEQMDEIKKLYDTTKNKVIQDAQQKVDEVEAEQKRLMDSREGVTDIGKRSDIYFAAQDLNNDILYYKNRVAVFKNGGDTVSFTDKRGLEHTNIPSFTQIKTTDIVFSEDTILSDPIPPYIPYINEELFGRKGYVFESIRIAKNEYILATNGYSERKKEGYKETKEHPSDIKQGYVICSLDQLVLISDYYYTKAKAKINADAIAKDKKAEERYDALSREMRARYIMQKGIYRTLPASVKKLIPEAQWDTMDVEDREKYYKPFAKATRKRVQTKLGDNSVYVTFHEMYERFMDPEAMPVTKKEGTSVSINQPRNPMLLYGNPDVMNYWARFAEMMTWKLRDIKVQREIESEIRKIAMETSFGESNTNPDLKSEYGILVKRQNGSIIQPSEIEQIKLAWIDVQSKFGGLSQLAGEDGLKISHTADKYVFASRASGMYIPKMRTIAVTNKFGDKVFRCVMAHEVAHYIDNRIGEQKGERYSTDDYEGAAGMIASKFRRLLNEKTESDYLNATKECFARALEQYFAIEAYGYDALYADSKVVGAIKYVDAGPYVNKENFDTHIKPLITTFLEENKDFFKYTVMPVATETKPIETMSKPESKRYQFNNEFGSFTSVFVYVDPRDASKFTVQTSVRKKNDDGTVSIQTKEKEFPVSDYESFIKDLATRVGNFTTDLKSLRDQKSALELRGLKEFAGSPIQKKTIAELDLINEKIHELQKGSSTESSTIEIKNHFDFQDKLFKDHLKPIVEKHGWKVEKTEETSKSWKAIIKKELVVYEGVGEFAFRFTREDRHENGKDNLIVVGGISLSDPNGDGDALFRTAIFSAFIDGGNMQVQLEAFEQSFNEFDDFVKGAKTEQEHKGTLEKVASGDITPVEGAASIAKDHRKERKDYYDKLDQVENADEIIAAYEKEKENTIKLLNEKADRKSIDHSVGELIQTVENDPFLFKDFVLFNETLPKKHQAWLNINDTDMGMPNVVEWLKKEGLTIFDVVPLKNYSLPKTKTFETAPSDKTFMSIHAVATSDDSLRPSLMGTHFDEFGVSSTNAHVLLFTKYRGSEVNNGNYCHTKNCMENQKAVGEAKFPAYRQVVPRNNKRLEVNAEALYDYLKNCDTLGLINRITHQVVLDFGGEKLGFNAVFLIDGLKAMAELGHKQIELGYSHPTRAMIIAPKGRVSDAENFLCDFSLIMPVAIYNENAPYYDLIKNCYFETSGAEFCFDGEIKEKVQLKKKVAALEKKIEDISKPRTLGVSKESVSVDIPEFRPEKLAPEKQTTGLSPEAQDAIDMINELLPELSDDKKQEALDAIEMIKELSGSEESEMTIKIGTGVFNGDEKWRIVGSRKGSDDIIGAYSKAKYTKEEAEKLFRDANGASKMAQGGSVGNGLKERAKKFPTEIYYQIGSDGKEKVAIRFIEDPNKATQMPYGFSGLSDHKYHKLPADSDVANKIWKDVENGITTPPFDMQKAMLAAYKKHIGSYKMAQGGNIEIDAHSLIGKRIQIYTAGYDDMQPVKITGVKVTPEHFEKRFVKLSTGNTEENIPLAKFNEFLAGDPVTLKDDQGESYMIELA